jgi:hypothetical protein
MKVNFEKMTKICSSCDIELLVENFGKNIRCKDNLNVYCKCCAKNKAIKIRRVKGSLPSMWALPNIKKGNKILT